MYNIDQEQYNELLIGSGSARDKRICITEDESRAAEWTNLVTLDYVESHDPDVVHDLRDLPLPFADNTFNEIHAYEVLEHIRQQGDYLNFFADFEEYWRILKPNGMFYASVPAPDSPWVWGDPSHTRAFPPENLVFLSQQAYREQVGVTAMSDFRFCYKADFKVVAARMDPDTTGTFWFALQAVKSNDE